MFFGKKKTKPVVAYNKETMRPVIKCSICTGEQVAGFKELSTGRFIEVMLIRRETDLEAFMEMYQLEAPVDKEY